MKSQIWRALVDNMRITGHGLMEVQEIASKIGAGSEELIEPLKDLEKEGFVQSADLGTFSHPNSCVQISPLKKRMMEADLRTFHGKWRY